MDSLRKVNIVRYLEPLKEGGSLPGLVEADDGFKYVIKFKGAGQGFKALVAELIGGLVAKELGLKIPELVFAYLDESFGRTEPDQEIQDLLKASEGDNLGLHFLSGAVTFDPVAFKTDDYLASQIVWLDAYLMNVDRTVKNTNLLNWQKEIWLIDHGACLYFHHNWEGWEKYIHSPFAAIKNHLLIAQASQIEQVDSEFKALLSEEKLNGIVDNIPDAWLEQDGDGINAAEKKTVYKRFLTERLVQSFHFVKGIQDAR